MNIIESPIPGVFRIEPRILRDERGFFARDYCEQEYAKHGLETGFAQCNMSYNKQRGIIRGMHFQTEPHQEIRLVRCTRGAIFDVVVDNRPDSPTYLQWFGAELSEENRHVLYVPRGFAHGYQTLTEDAGVYYQVSTPYAPDFEGGLRWNDPAIGIEWPTTDTDVISVSAKDAAWPLID